MMSKRSKPYIVYALLRLRMWDLWNSDRRWEEGSRNRINMDGSGRGVDGSRQAEIVVLGVEVRDDDVDRWVM